MNWIDRTGYSSVDYRESRPVHPLVSRGFTLIELLVVLTLTALLLLMTTAFGIRWTQTASVTQAQATLQRAYAVAKSTALANPAQQVNGAAAAMMCFSGAALYVYTGGACSGSAVWQGTLPSGVSIVLGNASPSCIALTNAATPMAGSGNCSTSLVYSISKGSANVTGKTLY